MDNLAIDLGSALFGSALSAFLFNPLWNWMGRKVSGWRGTSVNVEIVQGPVTWQYGFPEPAIKVTFKNASGVAIRIEDVRLRINKNFGLPVPREAPPPRSHPEIPATVPTGSSATWYFPAEKVSHALQQLLSPHLLKRGRVRTHVILTGNNKKTYKSPIFEFSLDSNSHWQR